MTLSVCCIRPSLREVEDELSDANASGLGQGASSILRHHVDDLADGTHDVALYLCERLHMRRRNRAFIAPSPCTPSSGARGVVPFGR